MDLQLRGKRALVTGSSSGIGVGIAQLLATEAVEVIVHGRNRERALAVAAGIRSAGGSAVAVIGDLSQDEGARAVAAEVHEKFGVIDILVNNAGGKSMEGNPGWFQTPWAAWIATFEQNIGAAVRMCHHFAPGMRQRGWGRIINISSGAGAQPVQDLPDYSSTKAALNNLTVGLSKALGGTGITVNTISPGAIVTPALESWIRELARQRQWGDDWSTIEQRYITEFMPLPVPRLGRPQDIAAMVALVASPLGGYITGANLRVDGGVSQGMN